MNVDKIKKDIREFILEEFLSDVSILSDNESLFEAGIIDSLGMIKLTAFIEETFGVVVNPSEVTIDNFDTVDKISIIICDKKGKDV